MKKKLKIIIPVVIILILVVGCIVITNLPNKDKTDINTEGVIAEVDATEDDEKETSSTNASTTENKTNTTTGQTTNATTEAATERPATTTERPAATTEAPASNHTHNWVKVVDRAAYDEPIYTEKPVYEERPVYETQTTYVSYWRWPDGSDASALKDPAKKVEWCMQHCTRCFPDCPDPDPRGYCAFQIKDGCEEVTTRVQTGTEKVQVGTEKVQTGTKHHDEEYHYECTCGARK